MSKQATVQHPTETGIKCLRAQGIGDDDMTRLAAFLRIGSDALRHPWQISSAGHYDALLVGDEETVPMLDDSVLVIRLVDAGGFETESGQLCRPLSFEALVAQLVLAERQTPRATPPIAAPEDPVAEPVAAPDPESDAGPVISKSLTSLHHGTLYRLERLPASSTVSHDRRVLTITSLLTLRALQFDELAAQSGLSTHDCEAALAQLRSLGVLQVIVPTQVPTREQARGSRRARPVPEAPGVVARWRERLGLGGR